MTNYLNYGDIATAEVIRRDGQDCSLNGLTSIYDFIDIIFLGDVDVDDQTQERNKARVRELIAERGNMEFLVAQDRGKYGWSIKPAEVFAGIRTGVTCVHGGNSIKLAGQTRIVHDRVETWEMYRRMSI